MSAPRMIPKFATEVLSAKSDASRPGRSFQKDHDATSIPTLFIIFEAHKRKALVTPHGRPVVSRTNAFKTASPMAPTQIGHEPRAIRAMPTVDGTLSSAGGRRRRMMSSAATAIAARIASERATPPHRPNSARNETGSANFWKPLPVVQKSKPATPSPDPMMKPTSVIPTARFPEPVANNVPDAHEPPSCIPIPNRAAPMNKARVIGA